MKSTPSSFTPLQRRLAIVLLALVAYAPTLRMGFLWDDHVMIETNPWVRHWDRGALKHDFTTDIFEGQGNPYYRPAQAIANRIDYTLWGLHPFGYHLTNLAAHAASALALDALLIALGFSPLTALLAASLFAVHPIGVEQLMIIAGRAELFGFLFTLLTLLFLLREDAWGWIGSIVSFSVGILFKENIVITPLLGALVLWFARKERRFYARLIPLILLIFPYLWLRQRAVGPALPPIPLSTIWLFLYNVFPHVLFRYVLLMLVPWNLHSHRLLLHVSHAWPLFLIGLGLILLIAWKKAPRLTIFCFGWLVLTLLPKIPGMYAGNFMLDHWAYASLPAVLLPLAIFFDAQWSGRSERRHELLALLYFPLLIGWALLVHLNVALRGTDEKMYRWALHFTTSNPIQYNLGVLLLETDRPVEALPYLENVHAAYPEDAKTTHALALAYWQSGHRWLAHDMLVRLVREHPAFQPAVQSLHKMDSELPPAAPSPKKIKGPLDK